MGTPSPFALISDQLSVEVYDRCEMCMARINLEVHSIMLTLLYP